MSRRTAWLSSLLLAATVALAVYFSWTSGQAGRIPIGDVVIHPFLPAHAADSGWPFIRGPGYDGLSPEINLADSWPEAGPPVLWRRKLGQGYSAFVAQGDRVYTQAQTLAGQAVVCLHADTGETLWEYRYDWPYDAAGVYPGPRATPTLYENQVYFAAPNGLIGCLTAETGELVWSVNVLEKYSGRGVEFGYACSPTVLEGRVLLPVGGSGASLVALSAADGAELWRSGDDPASYTPLLPVEQRGRKLVIGFLQNTIVGCDRETGELLWRNKLSAGYDEHSAWPIYRAGKLWTASPFRGGSIMYQLPQDEGNGLKPIWSSKLLSNDVMSSVLVGDHIYGFDIRDPQAKTQRSSRGVFRCLSWETGEPAWTNGDEHQREPAASTIGHASLLAADGKLILLNDIGELILVRASPESYQELGRASILPGEIGWTPPILHRGRVFVRNHSQAACVYVGRTELLEESLRLQAIPAAELPPRWQADWTHVVLPVEPEYAFDAPSAEWLANWFAWSLAILTAAWCGTFLAGAWWKTATTGRLRTISLALAGLAGLVGTSLLSRWRNELIFTWPLALYAVFHLAVSLIPLTRREINSSVRRNSLLAAVALAISAGGYFWLCRRLSLVFEWAFLTGYLPALLVVFLDRYLDARPGPRWLKVLVASAISLAGFAAFYWSGVGLLWWRYR